MQIPKLLLSVVGAVIVVACATSADYLYPLSEHEPYPSQHHSSEGSSKCTLLDDFPIRPHWANMTIGILPSLNGYRGSVQELTPYNVSGYTGVYSFFLRKAFERMGMRTTWVWNTFDYPERARVSRGGLMENLASWKHEFIGERELDHIVNVLPYGFSDKLMNLYLPYRSLVTGCIGSIREFAAHHITEDLLFYSIPQSDPSELRDYHRSVYVGWGADPEYLYAEKSDDVFEILVDHRLYKVDEKYDYTDKILASAVEFSKSHWAATGKRVVVRHIAHGSVVQIANGSHALNEHDLSLLQAPSNDSEAHSIAKLTSYGSLLPFLRRADVFIVTHRESLGLTILEAAMAGALAVIPDGRIIKEELRRSVRHYLWRRPDLTEIDWNEVLRLVDPELSRQKVNCFTYDMIARRIMYSFDHLMSLYRAFPERDVGH